MDPERSDLEGLCRITDCDLPAMASGKCFQHLVCLFLGRRGVLPNTQAINKTDEALRANLGLRLRAHYNAVISGDKEPQSQRQRLTHAYALRSDLGISWGGPAGLLGIAQVIGDVEKLAEKAE